jgi:hypothetical protein
MLGHLQDELRLPVLDAQGIPRNLSTPSNNPDPALNIVMYCKEINKTHKKYF